MSQYPEVITPELLAHLWEVSDDTIAKDIRDTESEIEDLRKCQEAYALLATHSLSGVEREMSSLKADKVPHEIARREDFIAYLKRLQEARANR